MPISSIVTQPASVNFNSLQITFSGPASVNDTIVFYFNGVYPNIRTGSTFKTTRVNPGEVTIGTDANSQALNYYNAMLLDYGGDYNFTISSNIVTISAKNGSQIYNFSASGNFATIIQPSATVVAAYRPVLLKVAVALASTQFTVTAAPSVIVSGGGSYEYEFYFLISPVPSGTITPGSTIKFIGNGVSSDTYTISSISTTSNPGYLKILTPTVMGSSLPASIINAVGQIEIAGTNVTQSNFIPPVVYCDVYVGGTYYKTISKSQYESIDGTNTYWLFDVQDALQEQLPWAIGTNGADYVQNQNGIALVQCYFRSSYTDTNGFIQPDTPIPIQATGGNSATAGGGTPSNPFFAVLATLQQAEIQVLATALSAYQYGTWGTSLLPLSHRPANYTIRNILGSDFYPLLVLSNLTIPVINFVYQNIGSSTWVTQSIELPTALSLVAGSIFLLGAGQKNVNALAALVSYSPNFPNISQYYLQLVDGLSTVQATTPTYIIDPVANPDIIRIHFLNYCGQFDAADFERPAISHEDKSTSFQKTLPYNFLRRDTGIIRQNITSNDDYSAIRLSNENEMTWLQELADSPQIFLEETRNQSGVADDYIPLIKVDGKFDKQKNNGSEYQYQFKIQFKLGNENIILRN